MFRFICVTLALVAVSSALPSWKEGRQLRIDSTIEEHPYQVSVEHNGKHVCAGAIITPTIILTSAACTHTLSAANLIVRAGSSKRETGGVEMIVKTVISHSRYMETRKDYDIAVLVLDQELEMGNTIQKIALPSHRDAPIEGTVGVVTGWGVSSIENDSANLESVEVKVPHPINCKNAYAPHIIYITERMFCAGHSDGKCKGDSGSPLVIDNALAGLSAWEQSCGQSKYPGIYTNVGNLKKWINAIIEANE